MKLVSSETLLIKGLSSSGEVTAPVNSARWVGVLNLLCTRGIYVAVFPVWARALRVPAVRIISARIPEHSSKAPV